MLGVGVTSYRASPFIKNSSAIHRFLLQSGATPCLGASFEGLRPSRKGGELVQGPSQTQTTWGKAPHPSHEVIRQRPAVSPLPRDPPRVRAQVNLRKRVYPRPVRIQNGRS